MKQVTTPDTFVSLAEFVPDIELDIRYAASNNFLGRPVTGYEVAQCLLTHEAARALVGVSRSARARGLRLKVFDGYRPRRAVADFMSWTKVPDDPAMKCLYYPNIAKHDLLRGGYIAADSSHSRGSTVDLTLARRSPGMPAVGGRAGFDGDELDMGTPFDFFDEASHTLWDGATAEVQANRRLLRDLMHEGGFIGVAEEWWHFTLHGEPFPLESFDFPITS